MKLYSLVLCCASVCLVWQNGSLAIEYLYPGRNVTYECTASGGLFTVWRGSALGHYCVITLYHHHFGSKDAFGSCNNGTIVGQGIKQEKDNYTSLLTVFVSPDLNGKTIECHLVSGRDGDIRINSTMLHLYFSALKPPILKCKPHYLNSTRILVRLETTFDKMQPFSSSSGGKVSVLSYTIIYSASNSGDICESATISASSCDQYHICEHVFEVSTSSCQPTTDIDVAIFADSTYGRGPTSNLLKREGVNTFVDVRYDQERNAIACLFQNQPLDIRKECAIMYTGLQPKRRFGYGTNFVAINNTSLNTNCFEEVRVEARSGVHTPVSVIMDAKEGPCPKAASLSINAIMGGVCGAIVLVAVFIVLILCCIAGRKRCRRPGTQEVPDNNLISPAAGEEGQQLSRSDVISALEIVTKPYKLGVYLGIDIHELEIIEYRNSKSIEQQKIEIIDCWFDNFNPSWKALADAVKSIGIYDNLAKDLLRKSRLADK